MTVTATRVPGRPRLTLGPLTTLWRAQPVVVTAAMFLASTVMLMFSVGLGEEELNFRIVAEVFTGGGTTAQQSLVVGQQLARSLAALFVGAALALSGAIIQSLTRKPPASPDVLGVTSTGAAAAAVTAAIGGISAGPLGWTMSFAVLAAAFTGCLIAGVGVLWLSRKKHLDMFRMAFTGICIIFLMQAITRWTLARNGTHHGPPETWLVGSLSQTSWQSVTPVIAVTAVAVPVILSFSFRLKAITLGEATANGLGVHVRGTRIILTLLAVALAAVAVTAAGPIMFVAFAAPQVALRLANTATPPLVPSAVTGGALLLAADIIARLIPGAPPAGLITGIIGGFFFLVFLVRTNQRTTT